MSLDKIIAILDTLVRFDTTSAKTNLPMLEWIEGHLGALGFRLQRQTDETGTKANLIASIGPANGMGYILSGHTDVVPVTGQPWSSDPFRLRRDGGRLYGRGTCDMKGFIAVCLAKAEAMAQASLAKPLHFIFSHDEEVGCLGAKRLTPLLATSNIVARGCFVGEPTSMDVVIGHKAKRNLRGLVHGRSCHSSLAPLGVNAAEYAAEWITGVRRIATRLRYAGPHDDLFDIPYSTIHVGRLEGGIALNIVPDITEILFEMRMLPEQSRDNLTDELIRHARSSLEPEMRAVAPTAGFSFTVLADTPGLDNAPDADIVTLGHKLAQRNNHRKVSFMTEAGLFQAVAGIPTVVVGPGAIDQAHTPDEWIAETELLHCAAFIDRLITHCET